AMVDAGEVEEEIRQVAHPPIEWVEEAKLDVAMCCEHGETRILPLEMEVIEQYPHAHAAIGSIKQRRKQVPAARVGVPQEILDIDCFLRGGGKSVAADKCFAARAHERKTRLSWMGRELGGGELAKRRRLRVRERRRCSLVLVARRADGARAKQHDAAKN